MQCAELGSCPSCLLPLFSDESGSKTFDIENRNLCSSFSFSKVIVNRNLSCLGKNAPLLTFVYCKCSQSQVLRKGVLNRG